MGKKRYFNSNIFKILKVENDKGSTQETEIPQPGLKEDERWEIRKPRGCVREEVIDGA